MKQYQKYKGLFVPETDISIEDIRALHCKRSKQCTEGKFCNNCIYSSDNLKQFKVWYKSKKK